MPGNPVRYGAPDPTEPVIHELQPLIQDGEEVAVRLAMRRADDGTWRGRLLFGGADDVPANATADIFCAVTESDLWECVRELHDYHVRDLYRSVSG